MKPVALVSTLFLAAISIGFVGWLAKSQFQSNHVKPKGRDVDPVVKELVKELAKDGSKKIAIEDLKIPESGPYAKAVPSETEHDFGAMLFGSKGSHVFVIKNEGEIPMIVKSGETSCGQCTFGKLSSEAPIAPGESVEVEINWHIKVETEEFRQWAEVFTTDPKNKRIELVIKGRTDIVFHMLPGRDWAAGSILGKEPTVLKGALYSSIADDIEITKYVSDNSFATLTWEKGKPEEIEGYQEKKIKSVAKLTATIAPGIPIGPFRSTFDLTLPFGSGSEYQFVVNGQRAGPIEIKGLGWSPEFSAIVLGEIRANEGKKAKFNLYVREMDGDFEVQSIEQKFNSVKVSVSKEARVAGKAKIYEIEIEVPPGPPVIRKAENAEEVRMKINHPSSQEFRFIVSYRSV